MCIMRVRQGSESMSSEAENLCSCTTRGGDIFQRVPSTVPTVRFNQITHSPVVVVLTLFFDVKAAVSPGAPLCMDVEMCARPPPLRPPPPSCLPACHALVMQSERDCHEIVHRAGQIHRACPGV